MATIVKAGLWDVKKSPNKGELDLDRLISTLSPPAPSYTFSNGLSAVNGNVVLGGTLSQEDTNIEGSDIELQDEYGPYTVRSSFNIGTSDNRMGYSNWYMDGLLITIPAENATNFQIFTPNDNTSTQITLRSNNNTSLRTVVNSTTYSTNGIDRYLTLDVNGIESFNTHVLNFSTVTRGFRIRKHVTGGLTAGVGTSLDFFVGQSSSNTGVTTGIEYILTDTTVGSHDAKYVFKTLVNHVSTSIAEFDRYGWRYLADYSTDYTTRSLVDKAYVDAAVSDVRLKENITDLPNTLEKINLLRPVEFDMKATKEHKLGFIAQEVEGVFPDMVMDDESILKILRDGWFPIIIKGMQEISTELASVKAELQALKNK